MSEAERPSYTFGDTPLAVERLRRLADVFAPASRPFLREAVTSPPGRAVDLGCGPGASTRLVAEVTGAAATVGLDASLAYVEAASVDATAGVEFACHDATDFPWPRVDLAYCRLLLAHLPDVAGTVAGFVDQLTPDGVLLVDEMEWLDAPEPTLATYERIVVDLVGSRGASMYAGPIVSGLVAGDGWVRRSSGVRVLTVDVADAARLYGMNLTTWRNDPHIVEHHPVATIDRLASDLATLAADPDAGRITWGVRQAVFARA
jgi:trans-aconitate 2-methyltransferase